MKNSCVATFTRVLAGLAAFTLLGCNESGGGGTQAGAGGAGPNGGNTMSGGAKSSGGAISTGGSTGSGGSVANGGTSATGGRVASGGATGMGGREDAGGSPGSGGRTSSGGNTGAGGTTATGGTTSAGGRSTGTGGTAATGGTTGGGGSVSGGATGTGGGTGGIDSVTFMGKSTVLIGRTSTDQPSVDAPFDAQYQYVVSPPAPTSDLYTAKSCPDGTNWWGCVGGSMGGLVPSIEARGAQATYLGQSYPQTVMWTWFELGLLAPVNQWQDEVTAVNQADLLTRYLNDYRFFLQKIGTSHDMIDLEPDFFGFARGYGPLDQDPAQVTAANPTDCGNQANTVAGLAHCLIAMTRKYAPNTAVGLHLTCWDWPGNVDRCAKDYVTLGGKDADFLVGEVESTDAGLNAVQNGTNSFWSDEKWATQLAYWKQMAEAVGHPIVVWQIPIGNMAQNNTDYHYQDDKVDWLFSHMDQVATAHVAALMFGQGSDLSTTAETDGGNLFAKTIAYQNSGGTPLE